MSAATHASVSTKHAERRDLAFTSTAELAAELDRLERADAEGGVRVTGNWTLGQQADHLARFWRASLDGFPEGFKPPAPVRWAVQLLFKKRAVRGAVPPSGMKLPKAASFLLPADGVTTDQGFAALRDCISRTDAGDAFIERSPLFGDLTHDEWLTINLSHCALHLGFAHPPAEA